MFIKLTAWKGSGIHVPLPKIHVILALEKLNFHVHVEVKHDPSVLNFAKKDQLANESSITHP